MIAFIGLGSNLGERETLIRLALDDLERVPSTRLERVSSLYDTEPVGEVDQPSFLNAVAQVDTELTPGQLLWNLQLIERRLGRTPGRRWGPRTMDLDLLLFGDQVIDQPDLKVPHPEMTRRGFVLVPLLEIDPLGVHPQTGEQFSVLLSRLDAGPRVRRTTTVWTRDA